ncbi:hypothetical protein [Paraburkholderia fungorum]|uniref:hypothetical protein n=1 Tax=Paraburkholderia fungorum TaxID=134537 RepID=UPI001C1EA49C|nr:hypothetical protein [Paraburkholderia fungorum]MBU7440928.1 hypothetical protein [Paraburkholderia fungorum]
MSIIDQQGAATGVARLFECPRERSGKRPGLARKLTLGWNVVGALPLPAEPGPTVNAAKQPMSVQTSAFVKVAQPIGSAGPNGSEKVRYLHTERVRQLFNIVD